jgi:hypothetical protein
MTAYTDDNPCPVCRRKESEHHQHLFCCPFCGSQAQFESYTTLTVADDGKLHDDCFYRLWCPCHDCRVELRDTTAATLIERWNRRSALLETAPPL